MTAILIKNARIIDPTAGLDGKRDLLAADGVVSRVAEEIKPEEASAAADGPLRVVDAEGLWLLPGLVDVHVHFREPGFTRKETIATGSGAAAGGGFSSVVCEPNTDPPLATVEAVREVVRKAEETAEVRVYFKAAMTSQRAGRQPNDVAELAEEEGVVALSDDGDPIVNPEVVEQVSRRAAEAGILLSPHCEDSSRSLAEVAGGRNPGFRPAEPYTNEPNYVARDAHIAADCGCRIHFPHLSMRRSLEVIGEYRSRVEVTCEVTPHHLLLCREDYTGGDLPEVNPPLRSAADRDALQRAFVDGEIEVLASDHAPHTPEDKAEGAMGLIGLETTLGLVLTHLVGRDLLSPAEMVRRISARPAQIFGLPGGTLQADHPADMTLVDPQMEWTVRPEDFRSRSRNTPYAGWELRGRAVATYVAGEEVFAHPDFEGRKKGS